MRLSEIRKSIKESNNELIVEAPTPSEDFDTFMQSIQQLEQHAKERRVIEPDYDKDDLISDIKRETPDIDPEMATKMANFVFQHISMVESTDEVPDMPQPYKHPFDFSDILEWEHECFRQYLLEDPERFSNTDEYKRLVDFLEANKTDTPVVGNKYAAITVTSFGAHPHILTSYFENAYTLTGIDSDYAHFDFNGLVGKYPVGFQLSGDALRTVFLFNTPEEVNEFRMMLVMKFSDFRINEKVADSEVPKKKVQESTNPPDIIEMDVPLFIRIMEYAREDAKTDLDLHDVAEQAIKLSANGDILDMSDYENLLSTTSTKHTVESAHTQVSESPDSSEDFDAFMKSINQLEQHAKERMVVEPGYNRDNLIADINREMPDMDPVMATKMADFVFNHLHMSESAIDIDVQTPPTSEELDPGDPIKIISGKLKGKTGHIDSFSPNKRLVIVDLDNDGFHTIKSSEAVFHAIDSNDQIEDNDPEDIEDIPESVEQDAKK